MAVIFNYPHFCGGKGTSKFSHDAVSVASSVRFHDKFDAFVFFVSYMLVLANRTRCRRKSCSLTTITFLTRCHRRRFLTSM